MSINRAIRNVALVALASSPILAATPGPWNNYPHYYGSAMTGSKLVTVCKPDVGDGTAWDPCSSYIIGVVDGLSAGKIICLTRNATSIQLVAMVRKYLSDHPDRWGGHASALIRESLRPTFPCAG